MKRNLEGEFPSAKKIAIRNNDYPYRHHCFLDLTFTSLLLSSKIADIPHKLKYETIIEPIFEYCFGTTDKEQVWENDYTNADEDDDDDPPINPMNQLLDFTIDWIRDKTFIFNQLLNLPIDKFIKLRDLSIWNDKSLALHSIQCYSIGFFKIRENLNSDLFNDREFVTRAVKEDKHNMNYVSEELRNDYEFVQLAVQEFGGALPSTSFEMLEDRELVKLAVEQDGSVILNTDYQNDEEIMRIALETFSRCVPYNDRYTREEIKVIEKAREKFKNDRECVMSISKVNGYFGLKYASDELRNDREIVMVALEENPKAFKFVSDELKSDREIVKMVVMKDGSCLFYAPEKFKQDAEIAELALKSSPHPYYGSHRFTSDLEFCTKVFGIRGFYNIPYEFIYDREIALESIKINPRNLKHLFDEFSELEFDREFILQAVTVNGLAYKYVDYNSMKDRFKLDREIALAAVTQNGMAIYFVPSSLLDDEEIVLKAAETSHQYFEYASLKLRQNPEFLRKLVKINSGFFKFLPNHLKANREIVMEHSKRSPLIVFENAAPGFKAFDRVLAIRAVKMDGLILEKMCFQHRNDRLIVSYAVQQNKKALRYASYELRHDKEMLELCK